MRTGTVRHNAPVEVGQGVRLDLEGLPSSVSAARRFVRQVCEDWHLEGAVDAVMLLTSELATNAVLHARTAFAVVVSREGSDVRVDVLDGSVVPPRARRTSSTAATGRGVAMVGQLASRWGATPSERLGAYSKGVWFAVPSTGVEGSWDRDDDPL